MQKLHITEETKIKELIKEKLSNKYDLLLSIATTGISEEEYDAYLEKSTVDFMRTFKAHGHKCVNYKPTEDELLLELKPEIYSVLHERFVRIFQAADGDKFLTSKEYRTLMKGTLEQVMKKIDLSRNRSIGDYDNKDFVKPYMIK